MQIIFKTKFFTIIVFLFLSCTKRRVEPSKTITLDNTVSLNEELFNKVIFKKVLYDKNKKQKIGGYLARKQKVGDFYLNENDYLKFHNGMFSRIKIDESNIDSKYKDLIISAGEIFAPYKETMVPRELFISKAAEIQGVSRPADSYLQFEKNGKLKILISKKLDEKVLRVKSELLKNEGRLIYTDDRFGFINGFRINKPVELQSVRWEKGTVFHRTIYPDGSVQLKAVYTVKGQKFDGKKLKGKYPPIITFCWDNVAKKVVFLNTLPMDSKWANMERGPQLDHYYLCQFSENHGYKSKKMSKSELLDLEL